MAAVYPMAVVILLAVFINPVATTIPEASTPATVVIIAVIPTIDTTAIPAAVASPKPVAMGTFAVTTTYQAVVALPNTAARQVI